MCCLDFNCLVCNSLSFSVPGKLYFVIVSLPGYLHLYFVYLRIIYFKRNTHYVKVVLSPSERGLLYKEGICSHRRKFLPYRVEPFSETPYVLDPFSELTRARKKPSCFPTERFKVFLCCSSSLYVRLLV